MSLLLLLEALRAGSTPLRVFGSSYRGVSVILNARDGISLMTAEKASSRNRVLGFVSVLAFVALTNLAVTFIRLASSGDGHLPWIRVLIELVIAGGCVAWVTSRPREQLAPTMAPPPAAPGAPAGSRPARKWMRIARIVLVPALIAATTVSIVDEWGTIEGAIGRLAHLDWHWVRFAIFAEGLSVVAVALVGRRLLRAAGHDVRLQTVIGLGR